MEACKGMTTLETALVIPKQGSLSISKVWKVRTFSIGSRWWGLRAVRGECVCILGGVSKVVIPAPLHISLGIWPGFKFPNSVLSVRPHFVIYSFNLIHPESQLLSLVIICNFVHFFFNTSLKQYLIHSSFYLLVDGTRIFVRDGSLQKGVCFLNWDCKLPERLHLLRQTKEFGVHHFFTQGLEIQLTKFCHEFSKHHCDKSIVINFNPVSNSMIIKTVKDFGDLLIIGNVLVIEKSWAAFSKLCITSTEILPVVTVGHFNPSWIKVVRGTLFGPFENTPDILWRMGDEAEEEEEVGDGCLIFRAGTDGSGRKGLGIHEFWTGGSGMDTNVCAQSDRDFGVLGISGSVGAGMPCICHEWHRVLGEVFWVWTDSMRGSWQCLTICILINSKSLWDMLIRSRNPLGCRWVGAVRTNIYAKVWVKDTIELSDDCL